MCDGIRVHAYVGDGPPSTCSRSVRRRLSMHITRPRTALKSGEQYPVSGLGEGGGDSVCQNAPHGRGALFWASMSTIVHLQGGERSRSRLVPL